jgi:endoglucanase
MKNMDNPKSNHNQLTIGKKQLDLIEKLSNAIGVSGDEGQVRKIILEEIKSYASDIKIDALGNIIATCKSTTKNPMRVMIAAHMDEVGLMLVDEEEGGYYKFDFVGSIDPRLLPGKAVIVSEDHLTGIIGVKPVHLTTENERRNAFTLENMRIDLGEEQSKKTKTGDRATFATKFMRMGPSISGKALDNRLGVATLIELVKHAPYMVELIAAFTVQEEIGQRGARVAGYAMHPDAAIALDSTPSFDMPVWDEEENSLYNTKLGKGPAVYTSDSYTLSDPRLVSFVMQSAEKNNIPYQLRQPGGGGTDVGGIHKQRGGIPGMSISIPNRFPHSPVSLARIKDCQDTLRLLYCILNSITIDLFRIDR